MLDAFSVMAAALEQNNRNALGTRVPHGMQRQYFSYSSNRAPSYIPSHLFTSLVRSVPAESLVRKPFPNLRTLFKLREDLKNHTELRIQLFLHQLLLVYRTGLVFLQYTRADAQVGVVNGVEGSPYVGAHSSTLSSLRLQEEGLSDSSISFGHGSPFYHAWNSTIYLPEIANQIDSAIDRARHGGNESLRTKALRLLNKSAAGEITPNEGLRTFLHLLRQTIAHEKMQARTIRHKYILANYLSVAEIYIEHIEGDYPLLQKFSFRPLNAVVDERFYRTLQHEMEQTLVAQIDQVQEVSLSLPREVRLEPLLNEIIATVGEKRLTNSAQSYVKLCILSRKVRAATISYFIVLDQMSPHKREQDLASLSKIRGAKSVFKLSLSKEAASLHAFALKQIKEIQGVSNPQNISLILPHVLLQIGYEFLAEKPKGMPSRQATRNLQVLIQQKIREKGSVLTSTTSKYLESCRKAESVKGATKEYFAYLLVLASPIQEHEINKLWQIKTSKTLGKVGLAPKALALCQAVVQQIRAAHKVQEPRKLSHILSHLLLRA